MGEGTPPRCCLLCMASGTEMAHSASGDPPCVGKPSVLQADPCTERVPPAGNRRVDPPTPPTPSPPPHLASFGRCTNNCCRTVAWPSLVGFILSMGGAATFFHGLEAYQGKVSKEVQLSNDNYVRVAVGVWGVAFVNTLLLVQGFFSTGRCREWCCRPPMTRRAQGKCSCRRFCRVSYPIISSLVFMLLMVLVVATGLFAMAMFGALTSKKMADLVCSESDLNRLGAGFVLDLDRCVLGACTVVSRACFQDSFFGVVHVCVGMSVSVSVCVLVSAVMWGGRVAGTWASPFSTLFPFCVHLPLPWWFPVRQPALRQRRNAGAHALLL
jgi:hypothetical protein